MTEQYEEPEPAVPSFLIFLNQQQKPDSSKKYEFVTTNMHDKKEPPKSAPPPPPKSSGVELHEVSVATPEEQPAEEPVVEEQPKPAATPRTKCRALFDCTADQPGDLAFKEGDIITVVAENPGTGAVN